MGVGVHGEPVVAREEVEDLRELGGRVVVERDAQAKAVAQAGVALEELLDVLGVAGDDAHELVALGLEHLHERVDGLLAVVAARQQRVRLVDEEDPAHGALHHGARPAGRLAQVGRLEVGRRRLHEGARAVGDAERVEVGEKAVGELGLAGAGGSRERHVQAFHRVAAVLGHQGAHLAEHVALRVEADQPLERVVGVGGGLGARLEVGGLGEARVVVVV